jgi:hypothetical protein
MKRIWVILGIGVMTCVGCTGGGGSNHDPVSGPQAPANTAHLVGTVTDATPQPVADATVSIELPEGIFTATTGKDGKYHLPFPTTSLPTFVTAVVSKDGYVPQGMPLVSKGGQWLPVGPSADPVLRPVTESDVVFPRGLSLHHLGDGQFAGQRNAGFQKPVPDNPGTGFSDETTAPLTPSQLTKFTHFAVTLLAKGAECTSSAIFLGQWDQPLGQPGGQLVSTSPPQVFGPSASDGSYTQLTYTFSLAGFQPGRIVLSILSDPPTENDVDLVTGGGCPLNDRDDFEFTAVTGQLQP